jgi:class 3 adenylate cyclase
MVVNMLNSYFDIIVHEIIAQNGYVDIFIGDAVLAVFRNEFHLDRAIDACLAVRILLEKLVPDPNGLGFKPKVSIGIHSGEMVCGNIGSASLRRLDYTVIGDVVKIQLSLLCGRKWSDCYCGIVLRKIKQSFRCNKLKGVQLKHKSSLVNL